MVDKSFNKMMQREKKFAGARTRPRLLFVKIQNNETLHHTSVLTKMLTFI